MRHAPAGDQRAIAVARPSGVTPSTGAARRHGGGRGSPPPLALWDPPDTAPAGSVAPRRLARSDAVAVGEAFPERRPGNCNAPPAGMVAGWGARMAAVTGIRAGTATGPKPGLAPVDTAFQSTCTPVCGKEGNNLQSGRSTVAGFHAHAGRRRRSRHPRQVTAQMPLKTSTWRYHRFSGRFLGRFLARLIGSLFTENRPPRPPPPRLTPFPDDGSLPC